MDPCYHLTVLLASTVCTANVHHDYRDNLHQQYDPLNEKQLHEGYAGRVYEDQLNKYDRVYEKKLHHGYARVNVEKLHNKYNPVHGYRDKLHQLYDRLNEKKLHQEYGRVYEEKLSNEFNRIYENKLHQGYARVIHEEKLEENLHRRIKREEDLDQTFGMRTVEVTRNPIDARYLQFSAVEKGIPNTDSYRIYYKTQHGFISALHDIPLYANMADKIFNMIVEVPSMEQDKLEFGINEYLNPLRIQKTKMKSIYMWNYGSFPTTWENPSTVDYYTGKLGDGQALDVFDIGEQPLKRGQIVQVKVLGCLGLINRKRIDWKIIAININDTHAQLLNDIKDIHYYFPGFLNSTVEWFQHYNVPDGRAKNRLAMKGQIKNKKFALQVVEKALQKWILLAMVRLKHPGICMVNTISGNNAEEYKIPFKEAEEVIYKGKIPSVLFLTETPVTTPLYIQHDLPDWLKG